MKKLSEIGTQLLTWVRPNAFQREYELLAGEERVAILKWESTFGSLVSIQTAEEKWLVERSGFRWRRVRMHREADPLNDASFTFGWFGAGVLDCPRGGNYRWRRTKFWRSEWSFTGTSDFPIVQFRLRRVSFKSRGEIELAENASLHRDDIPLLILLGWYLMLVLQRRHRRRHG